MEPYSEVGTSHKVGSIIQLASLSIQFNLQWAVNCWVAAICLYSIAYIY